MSDAERYKSLVAVFVFLVKDNKVLLLQRKNTGYRDGDYDVPAGHLEEGETIMQAALREAKEEACVEIEPTKLQFSHVMHRHTVKGSDGRVYIDFFFTADSWSGELKIGEPEKCSDMKWCKIDALPDNFIEYQKDALEMSLKGVKYSEWGW